MNNLISVSCGNDSLAMLVRVAEIRDQAPDLFEGDSWTAVYCDTGWSRTGWDDRVEMTASLCEELGFRFKTLKRDVRNKIRKSVNDKVYGDITNPYGMKALIRKKAFFPNLQMKYCTMELKIKPFKDWITDQEWTPKQVRQWVGVRRAEGGRLGKSNAKDRANTVSLDIRSEITGYETVYPIAYVDDAERDNILSDNNIPVYPTRSEECYPCIYQMSERQLAELDEDAICKIELLEGLVTNFQKAKYDLLETYQYENDEIFGMFNRTKCGGKNGIRAQVAWAKNQIKQEDSQGDLFIINDKCKSGACGL